MPAGFFNCFTNCRICVNGELVDGERFVVSEDSGMILQSTGFIGGEIFDLDDAIIAPGFLSLEEDWSHDALHQQGKLAGTIDDFGMQLPQDGVTGYWASFGVDSNKTLLPRSKANSAALLGTNVQQDQFSSHLSVIKLLHLTNSTADIPMTRATLGKDTRLSISAQFWPDFNTGINLLKAGVSLIHRVDKAEHQVPALKDLFQRPGKFGLVSMSNEIARLHQVSRPWFTICPDEEFCHPTIAAMLHRLNPDKCIFVRERIGARQVGLNDCVKNMVKWGACDLPSAVSCVTESVADLMGETERGRLKEGCRADFVILNDEGDVKQTWIAGKKVWDTEG